MYEVLCVVMVPGLMGLSEGWKRKIKDGERKGERGRPFTVQSGALLKRFVYVYVSVHSCLHACSLLNIWTTDSTLRPNSGVNKEGNAVKIGLNLTSTSSKVPLGKTFKPFQTCRSKLWPTVVEYSCTEDEYKERCWGTTCTQIKNYCN